MITTGHKPCRKCGCTRRYVGNRINGCVKCGKKLGRFSKPSRLQRRKESGA